MLAVNADHAPDVIGEMPARPGVALVHLRNVGWGGCNFAVRQR